MRLPSDVLPNYKSLIERIHASATPMVLAVTGGGSGALAELLQEPGASATVLEAVVPYSQSALASWLGGPPDQAASERTARAMAMAAFVRARQLTDVDPRQLRGIGITASLATTRPKRGPHRIHVAWQSAEMTVVTSCELEKGVRTRAEEEQVATELVLAAVAEACGVEAGSTEQGAGGDARNVDRREQHAPPAWTQLLLGETDSIFHNGETHTENKNSQPTFPVFFPGAFNPIHSAHEGMAALAGRRCNAPVTWELSIANVDKPPLDFIEIADRLGGLAGRPVLLTNAPTFAEKSTLAPGTTFIVGADTIARIGDPRYYHDNPASRDAALAAIAAHHCRFLVFGRLIDGSFRALDELGLPPALRELCDEVGPDEFRRDISSTDIRKV